MTKDEKEIIDILKNGKGFVTSSQITKAGIPRRCLSSLVATGTIQQIARGVYALPDAWEDDFYLLQHRFPKGIFSHESALYLQSMTDRTPSKFTMTFPSGYNPTNVYKTGVKVRMATMQNYDLGIVETVSPQGNPLQAYNIERTLCDLLQKRHRGDIQVINQAMKDYIADKKKDIAKLLTYAETLRVKSKVLSYLEVLL